MWTAISGFISFISKLMGYEANQQLIDAGKAENTVDSLKATAAGDVEGQKIDATVSTNSDAVLDGMLK